jgi:hypothetical protein
MTNTTTQNGNVQTTAVSITAATIALKSFANIFARLYFSLRLSFRKIVTGVRDTIWGGKLKEEIIFPVRRSHACRSRQPPDQDLLNFLHSFTDLLQLVRERRTGISQHAIL